MQIKSTLYFLFMLFQIKKLYLKCSLNSSLEKKWSAKISRSFTEYPDFSRLILICTGLTLFRMVFFGAAHGWVGAFLPPSLKPVTLSYNDETWHSYTLPKEDPKIYKSRDTSLEFCWHQHFFTKNQQILLHQDIQI